MSTRTHVSLRALAPRSGLVAIAAALTALSALDRAEACSCVPPSVESSYQQSTDVITARVLFAVDVRDERWHIAQVDETYKGCLESSDFVLLTTPASGAACGMPLRPGEHYLLNGHDGGSHFGLRTLEIGLCGYNLPVSALTPADRAFLGGRYVCCGDTCACADGSAPVACLVDPCQTAPACPEATTCVANYCGGCNAEHYDALGNAVCKAPAPTNECDTSDDCLVTGCSGQVCAAREVVTTCEFRPEYACYGDASITSCGCDEGRCDWARTPELAACIERARGDGGENAVTSPR